MIGSRYLDAIKTLEGFNERSRWDYAQNTNGYGTRARFDGETINRAEAESRFKTEIAQAYDIVERFAPGLDEGSKAALTSLTFNAGSAWTRSGLGGAIRIGDMIAARQLFQKYDKAGGHTLQGLVSRRFVEVRWFDDSKSNQVSLAAALRFSPDSVTASSPSTSGAGSVRQQPELARPAAKSASPPTLEQLADVVQAHDRLQSLEQAQQEKVHFSSSSLLASLSFPQLLAIGLMRTDEKRSNALV